jgi:hypothetical protein
VATLALQGLAGVPRARLTVLRTGCSSWPTIYSLAGTWQAAFLERPSCALPDPDDKAAALVKEPNYSSPLLPCAGSILPNVNRQQGQAYAMSPSTFWSGLILATSSTAVLHLGQPIVSSCVVSELSVIVACRGAFL